jgi:hypothetical protein
MTIRTPIRYQKIHRIASSRLPNNLGKIVASEQTAEVGLGLAALKDPHSGFDAPGPVQRPPEPAERRPGLDTVPARTPLIRRPP